MSARTGEGLDALRERADRRASTSLPRRVRLRFRARRTRARIAGVYNAGRVTVARGAGRRGALEAELPGGSLDRYREHIA